jgi:hypothetical protein
MLVDYFEVIMTAGRLQFIPVTESLKRGPAQDESNSASRKTCRLVT